MQHQHVVAEHEHLAIHRRRIRQPTCSGAFAAHRIGKVDGGVHFHLHFFVLMLACRAVVAAATEGG